MENSGTVKPSHDSSTRSSDVLTNEYIADDTWDNISEPLETGEVDDPNSDNSDYEEIYIKRKKKKASKVRLGSEINLLLIFGLIKWQLEMLSAVHT